MKESNNLKKKWNDVCWDYLRRFCDIIERDFRDAHWPGCHVGTVAVFPEGEAFNMEEIRYVVDNGIDGETVWEWWEYSYNIHALQVDYDSEIGRRELRNISLHDWCEGVPMPYLPEEIVKMKQKLLSK